MKIVVYEGGKRVVREMTPAEIAEGALTPTEIRERTSTAVNAERDRRMSSTFLYNGSIFDCDPSSLARITGAATLAGFAMGAGAVAGNLRWHGGATDFAWIDAANNVVTMDAQTTFGFGQAAATNEAAHIFAAKALKDMAVLPEDYIDDGYWP